MNLWMRGANAPLNPPFYYSTTLKKIHIKGKDSCFLKNEQHFKDCWAAVDHIHVLILSLTFLLLTRKGIISFNLETATETKKISIEIKNVSLLILTTMSLQTVDCKKQFEVQLQHFSAIASSTYEFFSAALLPNYE